MIKDEDNEPKTASETPKTHRGKYSVRKHLDDLILIEEQENAKENIRGPQRKGAGEEKLTRSNVEGKNSSHSKAHNANDKKPDPRQSTEIP